MKKLKYVLLIAILIVPNIVNANTTTNGVTINGNGRDDITDLYCEYSNGAYVLIHETDHLEIEPDAYSYPNYLPFKDYTYNELQKYDFLDSNNNWDCPLYATIKERYSNEITGFSNTKPSTSEPIVMLEVSKSTCEGKCSKFTGYTVNKYNCEYYSQSAAKKITIVGESNKCTITYPDGSTESMVNGVCGWITSSCNTDFFYNQNTKQLKPISYDYNAWFEGNHNHYNSDHHEFVCGKDKNVIDYYCSGACEYPSNKNIDCDKVDKNIKGESTVETTLDQICTKEGILKSFRFFGYLLFIVKILVPIILIIMGSIDFGKAMLDSNQDAVIKSAKALGYKIAAGVIVFLIPTIINFFFGLFESNADNYIDGSSTFANCRTCLFDPKGCNIEKDASGNTIIVNNVTNKKEAKDAINKVRKKINKERKAFKLDSCGTTIVCSNTLDNLEKTITQAESDVEKYIANGFVTEEASSVKKFRDAVTKAKDMIKKNRKELKKKSS